MSEPRCMIKLAWMLRFGIPFSVKHKRYMTNKILWQLCNARSDEARRIILGVSQ